jgi:hypothetical protein
MKVTGDARLVRKTGELDDAIATIDAHGLDPEYFDFEVQRLRTAWIPSRGGIG